jgi:signal transduction histidine kinase
MSSNPSFLRKVPLLAGLPDADLKQLCEHVEEMHLKTNEILFVEGSLGQDAYIIKEGQIEIYKTTNGQTVELAVRQPGEVIGEMALLEAGPRTASGRAITDSLLVVISHTQLDHLLITSPSTCRVLLSTITNRLRNTELLLRQSEKMAQLGTLTAGIAHELNNPAAAVKRSSDQMKTAVEQLQKTAASLYRLGLPSVQIEKLDNLVQQQAIKPGEIDAMARSDREAETEDWLEGMGVEDGWEMASSLVEIFESVPALEDFTHSSPRESLSTLLHWMAASYSVYRLLDEINQGSGRISEVVKALKSYVYLDQAPIQTIDIHEGLDNTLVILRYKLKQGVEVVREYDPAVPPIQAYGSELNQVWTNILDNAVDAMDGKGRIIIRTALKGDWVVVTIEDNGPGIPAEMQNKIFNPFFTTKPVGKGTGLGLSITYNIIHKHGGDIIVDSHPGWTKFEISLPLDFKKRKTEVKPASNSPV